MAGEAPGGPHQAAVLLVRRALAAAFALAMALTAPAAADLRLEGRGFGHGIGLSQWGAYGFAVNEDRDFRSILAHYYPGTTLERADGARIRVLLKQSRSQKLCSATLARSAGGRRVRLRSERSYRFRPRGTTGLTITDTASGRTRARVTAPVRVTGGASTCLRGTAENGRANRSYRGVLVLVRDGSRVAVINDVAMRHYLYGVVPAEVPASWPAAALEAQAVAARSYALRAIKPTAPFDVLPDTRSQVYGGVEEETATTTAAVQRTDPLVVFYAGAVAATYFSSSSGGTTAAVEEGFPGATPVPYLKAVDDPYDTESPHHRWTVQFTDAEAQRRLAEVLEGDYEGLEVVERSATGRVLTALVVGSEGEQEVPGTEVRALLGLRSTWFTVGD
jgi:stage II sporulation protein D